MCGLIRKAVSGALNKASDMINDLYANKFFGNSKIQRKKDIIFEQSNRYKELRSRLQLKNQAFVDTTFLGGDILADLIMNSTELPEDILNAYQTAYPNLASETPLSEAIDSMKADDEKIRGFVSGIKGKLFELKYVDYLNDGQLPDGYEAVLAESVTQPGWDIQITGPEDEVSQLLQAKATDSIDYVEQALEKYPDIDVVTTDEVYSQLVLNDAAENVIGSGMDNADLEEYIDQTISGSDAGMDWSPPILSLAMIAFSTYKKEGLDLYGKANEFGERFGASYICLLLGRGVTTLTGFWPLGIVMSLSSRYWAGKGRQRKEMFFHLNRIIDNNEKIIGRLESGFE